MSMNIQQFEQLIAQLMSPENPLRDAAEKVFNDLKKSPDFLISSLLVMVSSSQHDEVRSMCIVLLRRVLNKSAESLWPLINPQTQQAVKTQLLQLLENEKKLDVRSKLADCVAHIGSLILDKNGKWDELLPFMFKCTKSQDPTHRESALEIFSQLADQIGDQLRPYFSVLKDVLAAGLQDQHLSVKISALTATASFLPILNQPQERQVFQQLTPLMLSTISAALNAQNEEEARAALEVFVELAELEPLFLKPNLNAVISAMISIASAKDNLEDDTKHLALEFLVTLTESKAGMIRKFPKFLETVLPIVLNMMLDVEDDEEWYKGSNQEDDDVDITNSDIGEESLDRLAIALGGKTIVPAMFSLLNGMLSNQDWRYRHTGLMSISIIGEGAHKFLLPNLGEIVKLILPFLTDPHARVRWAACNTLGQMSTDFGPDIQKLFHAQILPGLAVVMDDQANPRVQSHAASALINFCEHCDADLIAPYLDALMAKLFQLLQVNKTIVQEQAITAIAAVADCAEGAFHKYYDTLMPFLKNILANANGKEYRMLRGKTMECVSLIGIAVGKEKFNKDAKDIMNLFMSTQSMKLDPDDPQIGFLLQSWARICRCLGQDFVPYLPHVMPALVASAKISPDIKITDDESSKEVEGWDYIPVGDKKIGIHTSGLEEKSTACNMLFCYASELKEGFFPYVEEVAKLLVPLMRFYYHDGVRSAAISTMPHLLRSASLYLQKSNAANGADVVYVRNLLHYILPNLLESMNQEVDEEILETSVGTLAECISLAGDNSLTAEQIGLIVKACLEIIEEVKERRGDRNQRKEEEDHDEEEEEKILNEAERDDSIMAEIGDTLGNLAHYNAKQFLPIFVDKLLNIVLQLLQPGSKISDRQMALCIFDDIAEYSGAEALPLFDHFLTHAINYITDIDAGVRQAAVYGMGVFAQVGGEKITPLIPEMYNRLKHVIIQTDSRSDNYIIATENAIGAVAKMIVFQAKALDLATVIPTWLSWLPVTEDFIEAQVTYTKLITLVESNNTHLLGNGFANLPHLIYIFAEILGTPLIDVDLSKRIVAILKQMQSSLPSELLGKAWTALSPENQQKLQKAVSGVQ